MPYAKPFQAQLLLTANNSYKGGIDNEESVALHDAIDRVNGRNGVDKALSTNVARWRTAAAQLVLTASGYPCGVIDGYWGAVTEGSWLEWSTFAVTGKKLSLPRVTIPEFIPPKSSFPKQSDCRTFYGIPGEGNSAEKQLVIIESPFQLRIDYSLQQKTNRIRIHKKCAQSLEAILGDVLKEYGIDRIRTLGLDRIAGTYVPRKMRGGNSWSMHAYGCAIDWYAAPNGLNTRAPQALFSRPEYKAYIDIYESHGWLSLGRAIGRDYMHFQAATL